ncbi:MAG TPA: DNA methyltransferase [Gemmataceae bacterium]|jgi:type I restriction-modification system DNA methylase subunit
MVAAKTIHEALTRVTDQRSFLQELLVGALEWEIPDGVERIDDISLPWSQEELRARGLENRLVDGHAWQIQAQRHGQPWGIFLLEFASEAPFTERGGLHGATGTLRQVLRGLVPSRRHDSCLPSWKREHLLFLCTHDYRQFRFAYFKAPKDGSQTAPLASFGWNQGDTHLRTLCEHNLPALDFPKDGGADPAAWVNQWAAAFDVEAVTKRFFAEYRNVFEKVEARVKGVPKGEPRRLYTQRLFNRLLFLYFIQRKGWLSFQGNKNYLRALFNAARAAKEDFLNERLYWTFFYGLNTAGEDYATHSDTRLKEKRGEVPFLNGGLFDLEDEYDVRDKVRIPNDAFAAVFDLLDRYNFTVTESTPLDIEVAVDPEMLGKVFEELVTGRHETGSYYTPRPIVAFMCRETLKHYLAATVGDETAVVRFVDENDPSKLPDPEAVLNALRAVKVCDPACGSGAYLLGMMQELLRLRETLFATRGLDAVTVYRRKLEIIQNNLYGVDIDLFAVNIAKLRLWLSLAVDFEGAKPPPLPNLDFKVECGDSLTTPDPQKIHDLFRNALIERADRLADLKGQFLQTYGGAKKKLAERIKEEEAKLRASLDDGSVGEPGALATGARPVDWRVAFAEVFKNGGFDIALENPPYVRQELFKDSKPILRRNFPQVYVATADLYVYFYARTHQILRPGGTACFISSNKWLKAGYGEALRRFFAASAWVESVVDFGHAKQIFQEADVFPSILVFRKPSAEAPPPTTRICAIPRERLRLDDLTRQVETEGFEMPREKLAADAWTLEPSGVVALLEKIRRAGVPLKEFAGTVPLFGIKTGFNDAFLLDTAMKERLVAADPKSVDVLKPYLRGQDVNRWHAEWAGLWMLALKSSSNHPWPWARAGRRAEGVFATAYPAIYAHMSLYSEALKKRQDQGEHWWELRACAYWEKFDRPKVMYQDITWMPCFCLDTKGTLSNNTIYFLSTADRWVLAALNSPASWWFAWRGAQHCKDEGLRFFTAFMEGFPVPQPTDEQRQQADHVVQRLIDITAQGHKERRAVQDWLRAEFAIEKPSQKLQNVAALDAEALTAEVQKARGKKKPLSVAQVQALNDEHTRSVLPLQKLAAEARRLERRVADLVNAAYGLTAEEVALMWQTAPPRMPGTAGTVPQASGGR